MFDNEPSAAMQYPVRHPNASASGPPRRRAVTWFRGIAGLIVVALIALFGASSASAADGPAASISATTSDGVTVNISAGGSGFPVDVVNGYVSYNGVQLGIFHSVSTGGTYTAPFVAGAAATVSISAVQATDFDGTYTASDVAIWDPPVEEPTTVTPQAPSATTPTPDNPDMVITLPDQEGVIWDVTGPITLAPGESITITATPADGYDFGDAQSVFKFSNDLVVDPPVTTVTPQAPSATTPTPDNPDMVITLPDQEGVIWDVTGPITLAPGESITITATPADGYDFGDAQSVFKFSNDLVVVDPPVVDPPVVDPPVVVPPVVDPPVVVPPAVNPPVVVDPPVVVNPPVVVDPPVVNANDDQPVSDNDQQVVNDQNANTDGLNNAAISQENSAYAPPSAAADTGESGLPTWLVLTLAIGAFFGLALVFGPSVLRRKASARR